MPDTATTGTDGAGAQSGDTPGAPNVSDGTPAGTAGPTANSQNDNSVSATAATRSDDTRGAGFDITKLLDRLDALPESIANAVKEATPATPPPAQTPANSDNSTGSGSTVDGASGAGTDTGNAVTRSRSERFAGWWFGK